MIITSLGSICFTRWNIATKLGIPYIASPFDNVENCTIHQFRNIETLLKKDFSQIEARSLEYREHQSRHIETGKEVVFRGYKYIGDELEKPFVLAHFLDEVKTEKEGWNRWHYKCNLFNKTLKDPQKRCLLSLRLNHGENEDTPERRRHLAGEARHLLEYIYNRYKRDKSNTRLISIIVAKDIKERQVETEANGFIQVAMPAGAEAETPYWHRQPKQDYIDIVKQFIREF